MEILYAVFLGLLQGATEFLPVSSSGHLILAQEFFGISLGGLAFDVTLHLGTLLAILVYFRNDFYSLGRAFFFLDKGEQADRLRRQVFYIVIATIPAVIAGVLLEDTVETTFRSPLLVAVTLSALGFLLWLGEKKGTRSRGIESMRLKDAGIIGLAQAFAIIPGVSRSGSTITAGLFLGLERPVCALFSFLLSAPIIFGAGIYQVPRIMEQGINGRQSLFYLFGFASSAFFGYLFIAFLMRFVRTRSLSVFAYYRFFLSGLVVVALVLGF